MVTDLPHWKRRIISSIEFSALKVHMSLPSSSWVKEKGVCTRLEKEFIADFSLTLRTRGIMSIAS